MLSFSFCSNWLPFRLVMWRCCLSMPRLVVHFAFFQADCYYGALSGGSVIKYNICEVSELARFDLVQYVRTFTKHGPHFLVGFRYLAPFWNDDGIQGTGVKNRSQIWLFTLYKSQEGMGEMSEWHFCASPRTQPLIYHAGGLEGKKASSKI